MEPVIALSSPMAQAFFHQHPDAVLVLDASGHVLLANAAASTWLADGAAAPDFATMTGVPWSRDSASAPDHARWSRRLRMQAADGSARQVDVSLFAVEQLPHEPPLHYCVIRDATAIVEAARSSHESQQRSRTAGDAGPAMVWMSGPDGACEWFNRPWLAFRGRTLGEELGDGWTQGVHPEDRQRWLGIYEHSLEAREQFSLDLRLRRHDGVYRWVMNCGVPRTGAAGEFIGYIGICVDIHDRKDLEDRLAEHTRTLRLSDRRREDFLAKLAHELRDPLGPIANAAAIVKAFESADPKLARARAIIERQVYQLRRIVTDLVDVTRITRGRIVLQRERFDADDLLDRAIAEARPEIDAGHHPLQLDRPDARVSCVGDAQRLSAALAALIGNAAKYSPDGAPIELALRISDDALTFVVTDHGRGVAPEFLPHVFDLFAQDAPEQSEGSLGVGLTIAQRIAELHGGRIRLESDGHDLGTTATLRLPRLQRPGAASDAFDLTALTGRRVLIIEDNVDARESLRLLVELAGNEVVAAANASEGLALAESFRPHLVVCDIGLPDIDGYELVGKLRETLAGMQTHYVALTGYGRVEDRERALDSGFDTFLVKPLGAMERLT